MKSQKDRALESLRLKVNKIKSYQKNKDWSAIQDEFDEVNRMIDRSKILIMKMGLPNFYVKMLADIEDLLTVTLKDKEGLKKMKQASAHAINRMKLTVRKHNKKYETEIANYREHPENYVDSEEEAPASDDEDDDDVSIKFIVSNCKYS